MAKDPGGVALILGKLKAKKADEGDEEENEHEGDDYGEGTEAAAREALDAIKSDDAAAFAAAMKSLVELCS